MLKKSTAGLLTAAIICVGCFGGYKVYADHLEGKKYQDAKTAIDRLFDDKSHKILADSVNSSLLDSDQNKINFLKNQDDIMKLNAELHKARLLLNNEAAAKQKVNSLLKDGILVYQVTGQQIEEAQQLVASVTTPKLHSNLQILLNTAKSQLTSQLNAEDAVSGLFADKTHAALADGINRNAFNQAKQLLDGVKNQIKKKQLSDLLATADTLLAKAENDQAKAKQAEAAANSNTGASKISAPANPVAATKSSIQTASSSTSASPNSNTSQTTGTTMPIAGSSNSSVNPSPAVQTGFAGVVAKSKTAQQTNQIVTVVANGTTANVTLWEKTNNQWGAVFSTGGMVGYEGVGQAHEGSGRTPRGSYTLGFAFGKSNPGTQLPFRQITPNSYWISDINSPLYNTWQEGNYPGNGNEHLADYENLQYYYAIVINYNTSRVKGAGSGFFLHISNGQPTAGCVAVPKSYMEQFMKRIHPGAYIINVTSESEVANY